MQQEDFLNIVKNTVIQYLSDQNTQEILVDDYVLSYMNTVFVSADYLNKDILSIITRAVSPILYNLKLTSSKDESDEVISNIFSVVAEHVPQYVNHTINNPISALDALHHRERQENLYKELQKSRDIYQQKMNYLIEKQHQKAQSQMAKRILKGKDSVFKRDLDKKSADNAIISEQNAVLRPGIQLNNISLSYGSNVLIKDCTASFHFGHRYCLVARNGTGKSTLLRAIATNEIHCIANREQLKVLYVAQEVPSSDELVIDVVLSADENYTKLNQLQKLLEDCLDDLKLAVPLAGQIRQILGLVKDAEVGEDEVGQALDTVMQEQLESGCFEKRGKASRILLGLLFTQAMQQKPTKELSGGWKMRVALAKALFTDPDILMLDEPTNNLDIIATLWLEDWLSTFDKKCLLIVVSHDISFINSFATDVVLLRDQTLSFYAGNYTQFAQARANEQLNKERQSQRIEMHRAHIEKFVNRFRYNANRAASVQSRLKTLDKMIDVELSSEHMETFAFPQAYAEDYEHDHLHPLVEMKGVCFHYAQNKLSGFKVQNVNLSVFSDSRIALCGANAAGKSTILKLLAGFLKPTVGEIDRDKNARCAVFWQHHQDQLDLNLTPIQTLQQFCPDELEQTYRAHLGRFGITTNMVHQTNRTLSGGQKTRLSLALLTFKTAPTILVLDELTNHIDIETKQALIEALQEYNGAVVVVSHDGPFVSAVTDQIYIVDEGKLTPYLGEFDDYREELKRARRK